jgi:tRNA threonylcarbamoyl adenosine modification protein (Sua5/YciO/YrdC/YwlC family)
MHHFRKGRSQRFRRPGACFKMARSQAARDGLMTERIELRADGPKSRLIEQIVAELIRGGLVAYPTDSGYALGWRSGNRRAADRVVRLRQLEGAHHFTYCCRTLSDISRYARVANWAHRLIRQLTPGPYTFVLPATSQVPRDQRGRKPATIGIRIPDHQVVQAMLEAIDEPLMSSSLIVPEMEEEIFDTEDLYDAIHGSVDLFVDAGYCPLEPTTLLDMTGPAPRVLREGQGVVDFL